MEDLQYPIGHFTQTSFTDVEINDWITELEQIPAQLKEAVIGLTDEQLDTPYRPEGWTVRQVVHHVADSHMHSYARFKFALTEDAPVIKPYNEAAWAELPDAELPVEVSLSLLESLHRRWTALLWNLRESDLQKTFHHPADGEISLGLATGIYSWHGRHHIAHITSLAARESW